jgi:hypothetical protein
MRSESTDARAYVKHLGWLTAAVSALAWAGTASGATPPPPEDVPAVSAYVELVPTSRGSRSPRVGAGGTSKLPTEVEAQLARGGGTDAPLLKEIATSRAYGAPPSAPTSRGPMQPAALPPDETALGAAVGVATDGSDERVLLLGGLLVLLTVGLGGAAVYRRRLAPG